MYDEQLKQRPRRPLQFGIRSLMVMTLAAGILFATLKWLAVPPFARAMLLVILVVSVAAGVGLVVAIANAADNGEPPV